MLQEGKRELVWQDERSCWSRSRPLMAWKVRYKHCVPTCCLVRRTDCAALYIKSRNAIHQVLPSFLRLGRCAQVAGGAHILLVQVHLQASHILHAVKCPGHHDPWIAALQPRSALPDAYTAACVSPRRCLLNHPHLATPAMFIFCRHARVRSRGLVTRACCRGDPHTNSFVPHACGLLLP